MNDVFTLTTKHEIVKTIFTLKNNYVFVPRQILERFGAELVEFEHPTKVRAISFTIGGVEQQRHVKPVPAVYLNGFSGRWPAAWKFLFVEPD